MKYELKRTKGFTLIELIIVIVLIGILSAVAIPRFINQTTNARVAAINGLVGALNTAISLAQIEYRAEGNSSSSTTTTITMDGTATNAVKVSAGTGTPTAEAAGIGTALRTLTGFVADYGTTGSVIYNFSPTISNCNVTYTAGVVTPNIGGC